MTQTLINFTKQPPVPPKAGTVGYKVLEILKNNDWITLGDLRSHFDKDQTGSQSVDRFIRFLRTINHYNISCQTQKSWNVGI